MAINKKQLAYNDIRSRVLALELAPGSAIEEAMLTDAYGLSRTPLREVLQRLAGEGYVQLEANRGATVAAMDLGTMRSFFQTAPIIYCAVARLAAENASPGEISSLRKIQDDFRNAVRKKAASDMAMLNHQFHEAIGLMSGNAYLLPSLNRLLIDHTRMSHRFYRPRKAAGRRRVEQACAQHDHLVDAIETGDAELAASLSLEHWELSRGEIEKYALPEPLPMEDMSNIIERQTDAV